MVSKSHQVSAVYCINFHLVIYCKAIRPTKGVVDVIQVGIKLAIIVVNLPSVIYNKLALFEICKGEQSNYIPAKKGRSSNQSPEHLCCDFQIFTILAINTAIETSIRVTISMMFTAKAFF